METVPIETLEDRLNELADRVERGETVIVTRDGKPVLDLVPHSTTQPVAKTGGLDFEGGRRYLAEKGIAKFATYIAPDFDDPLPEDFLLQPLPDAGAFAEPGPK